MSNVASRLCDEAEPGQILILTRPLGTGVLFHADLGKSLWQGVPVREQLAERLPVSFELGLMAMIIGLTIALPVGIYSAIRQDTAADYVTRSISILMVG